MKYLLILFVSLYLISCVSYTSHNDSFYNHYLTDCTLMSNDAEIHITELEEYVPLNINSLVYSTIIIPSFNGHSPDFVIGIFLFKKNSKIRILTKYQYGEICTKLSYFKFENKDYILLDKKNDEVIFNWALNFPYRDTVYLKSEFKSDRILRYIYIMNREDGIYSWHNGIKFTGDKSEYFNEYLSKLDIALSRIAMACYMRVLSKENYKS